MATTSSGANEPRYVLFEWVPYEGLSELHSGTEEEIAFYVKEISKSTSKDDLVLYREVSMAEQDRILNGHD